MNKIILVVIGLLISIQSNYAATVAGSGLSGQFSVSPTGAATYSIPLSLPPGIDGVQPSLSVNYNSQAGYSILGQGASLTGVSQITRCGQINELDGKKSPVMGGADDRLCLDGEPLLLVGGDSYWSNNAVYKTQIENFSKVESIQSGLGYCYQVTTKSGWIQKYGCNSSGTDVRSNSTYSFIPYIWYLTSAYQRERPRNIINYFYKSFGESDFQISSTVDMEFHLNNLPSLLLQKIQYASAGVTVTMNYMPIKYFDRKFRPNGFVTQNNFLLNSISVCDTTSNPNCGVTVTSATNQNGWFALSGSEQGQLIASYNFDYQDKEQDLDATMRRPPKLTSVTECGLNNQCFKPIQFKYNPVNYGVTSRTVTLPGVLSTDKIVHGDFNGDGLDDILSTPVTAPVVSPAPFPTTSSLNLIFSDGVNFGNRITGTRSTYPVVSGTTTYEDLYDFVGFDFYGTNLLGVITAANGSFYSIINQDTTGGVVFSNKKIPASSLPFNGGAWVDYKSKYGTQTDVDGASFAGDANSDGLTDWIRVTNVKLAYFLGGSTIADTNRLDAIQFANDVNTSVMRDGGWIDSDYQTPKFVTDVNGDGYSDVVVVNQVNPFIKTEFLKNGLFDHEVIYNYGVNQFGGRLWVSSTSKTNGDNVFAGDFNGDGLLDIAICYGSSHAPPTSGLYINYSKGDGTYYTVKARDMTANSCSWSWVADWNGDGIADIVLQGSTGATVLLGTQNIVALTGSTYNGQISKALASYTQPNAALQKNFNDNLILADFDGDGRTDYMDIPQGSGAITVWSNSGTNGELSEIDSSAGAIKVIFGRLTDKSLYDKAHDAVAPQVNDIQNSMQVVKSTQVSNGVGGFLEPTTYHYAGLKSDKDRGLLGFNWIRSTVVDDAARSSTNGRWSKEQITYYRQDFPYIGKVDSIRTFSCDYTQSTPSCFDLSKQTNVWANTATTLNTSVGVRTSYFTYLQSSHSENYRFDQMYKGGAVPIVGKVDDLPSNHPEILPTNPGLSSLPAILSILLLQ